MFFFFFRKKLTKIKISKTRVVLIRLRTRFYNISKLVVKKKEKKRSKLFECNPENLFYCRIATHTCVSYHLFIFFSVITVKNRIIKNGGKLRSRSKWKSVDDMFTGQPVGRNQQLETTLNLSIAEFGGLSKFIYCC